MSVPVSTKPWWITLDCRGQPAGAGLGTDQHEQAQHVRHDRSPVTWLVISSHSRTPSPAAVNNVRVGSHADVAVGLDLGDEVPRTSSPPALPAGDDSDSAGVASQVQGGLAS